MSYSPILGVQGTLSQDGSSVELSRPVKSTYPYWLTGFSINGGTITATITSIDVSPDVICANFGR